MGRCLGRGSFGEVYAATMRSPGGLESPVAVKLLRADLDLQGEAVRRLRDEGRLLARLNHPAILKVFDLVTLRGRLALITELVDGADLSDCVSPAIPARALLQALGQVAGALDAAYETPGPDGALRLVHRDVKPSNVRIERHGQTKLLDFGIARFDASDREVRTASDLVVGSVPYMAPERFVQREVATSSDVFSLGCTLYEGLTGERFYGTSAVAKITGLALQPEVFERVAAERIGALKVAAGVRQLLGDVLRADASARPTAGECAARMEALADQIGGPTLRMWCRERDWTSRRTLDAPLEGEVLEEGEDPDDGAQASGGSGPVVNLAPRPTLEPGTESPWAAGEPGSEAPTEIAEDDPTGDTPTRVDGPALAKPPPKDSVWERPFTAEAPRPARPDASVPLPPRISSAEPASSGPSVLVLAGGALLALAVLGGLAGAGLIALGLLVFLLGG